MLKRLAPRFLYSLVLCLFIFASLAPSVSANNQDFLRSLNAPLYEPSVCSDGSANPSTSAPTADSNSSIYLLGDSILEGAYYSSGNLKDLLQKNNWSPTADASSGRSITTGGSDPDNKRPGHEQSGLDALNTDSAALKKASTVVIELGTNSSGSANDFADQMKKVMAKVRDPNTGNPGANVYWLRLISKGVSQYDSYNTKIGDLQNSLNYNLIDLNPDAIPLGGDNIHPKDTAAYNKYSTALATAIGNAPPASSGSSAPDSIPDPSGTPKVDLTDIVSKYGLHSAMVSTIDNKEVASYNADDAPDATASVLKLLIADVLLHKNPDLSKTVKIKSSQLYSSGDATVGDSITLADVMKQTLSERSWDTGANVLMDEIGSFDQITDAAHDLGYTSTKVVTHYHDPPGGRNLTTVTDLTKAMSDIFAQSGANYKVAQDAMTGENHFKISPAPLASKWGGTSKVAGNSAIFDFSGTKYIVTLYINGNQADVSDNIEKASEAIAKQLNTGAAATTSVTSASCCATSTSGGTTLTGNDNEDKTWNFFIGMGLSQEQTAGIMGNMLQESHFNPQATQVDGKNHKDPIDARDGGWGIIQWSGNGNTGHSTVDKFNKLYKESGVTGDIWKLETQLNMVWAHLNNKGIVTQPFDLAHFKTITDESDAAIYFDNQIEGSGKKGGRFEDASTVLRQYKNYTGPDGAVAADADVDCSDTTNPGEDTKYVDGFTVYNQCDKQWIDKSYGTSTICASGCGPSAMAMIITNLTGSQVTPDITAKYAASQNLYISGTGTSWAVGSVLAKHWNLTAQAIGADEAKINAALQAGALVITAGNGPLPFTSGGHFIVIRGVTSDGKWKIGDSGHSDTSDKDWGPIGIVAKYARRERLCNFEVE